MTQPTVKALKQGAWMAEYCRVMTSISCGYLPTDPDQLRFLRSHQPRDQYLHLFTNVASTPHTPTVLTEENARHKSCLKASDTHITKHQWRLFTVCTIMGDTITVRSAAETTKSNNIINRLCHAVVKIWSTGAFVSHTKQCQEYNMSVHVTVRLNGKMKQKNRINAHVKYCKMLHDTATTNVHLCAHDKCFQSSRLLHQT